MVRVRETPHYGHVPLRDYSGRCIRDDLLPQQRASNRRST